MSSERKLLAACARDRGAYDLISTHCTESELTAPGRVVLGRIEAYYSRDPEARAVDVELLTEQVMASVPNPKHRETFELIMAGIAKETESSPTNVAHTILETKRAALGASLGASLAAGEENVAEAMEQYLDLNAALYEAEGDDVHEVMNDIDLDEILDVRGGGDLIRVSPKELNERLSGGMLRGEHIGFFARPEMGKTLFVVNAIGGFLHQGLTTLYIGNEEPVTNTAIRLINRLSGMNYLEVESDREKAIALARERGWKNAHFAYMSPGTMAEVEDLVKQIEPDVVILDQLRNIDVKEENLTRSLEKASKQFRQMAGRHRFLAMSLTQAGESATDKRVLGMSDIDSSKTGMPAAFDVLVGMGGTSEDESMNRRTLSLPKNKRPGGKHDFFPVNINPALSSMGSAARRQPDA